MKRLSQEETASFFGLDEPDSPNLVRIAMRKLIINGSSRREGHTHQIVQLFREEVETDVIYLADYQIGHYDYDHQNHDDDFLPLIRRIANDYDLIIFATPVYWYTMSGLMKVFFDRITDCLKTDKKTGAMLVGKTMATIGVGSDPEDIEGFFVPFRLTAPYMDMKYAGDVYTWIEDDGMIDEEVRKRVKEFGVSLLSMNQSIQQ